MKKTYIGDSVYADFDGYGIVLTTENGTGSPSNTIYFEPDTLSNLFEYVAYIKQKGTLAYEQDKKSD